MDQKQSRSKTNSDESNDGTARVKQQKGCARHSRVRDDYLLLNTATLILSFRPLLIHTITVALKCESLCFQVLSRCCEHFLFLHNQSDTIKLTRRNTNMSFS